LTHLVVLPLLGLAAILMRHWLAWPDGLTLLVVLPLLGVAAFLARWRRRRRLLRLGRLPALAALTDRRGRWQGLQNFLWLLALTTLVVGLSGPQWGFDLDAAAAPGRDLVVVLDVSRSMLTDDVPPDLNRFEHARKAVGELADVVQKRGGHRLALVAFAGRAVVVCPLTPDFNHFREKLADLDLDALPPELAPLPTDVSGTRIGAGVRVALTAGDSRFPEALAVLLLSDGDDPAHDPNEWLRGADEAKKAGVPVYTVAVGDPEKASPVPGPDGRPLFFDQQPVRSRLDEQPLKEIANRTGGTYTLGGTKPLPLAWLFRTTIEPGLQRDLKEDFQPPMQPRFVWFLGPALVLLILEMTVGGRAPKPVRVLKTPAPARSQFIHHTAHERHEGNTNGEKKDKRETENAAPAS
jgi:Ca-activated chloride channel family protein